MQSNSKISLNMFDAVGVFSLTDNTLVSDLVSEGIEGKFLSRSAAYYKQRTVYEHCVFREELKQRLNNNLDPLKQFVIVEHMLNSSARVLYNELKSKLKENMDTIKACVLEDVINIVNLFEGKPIVNPTHVLPKSIDVVESKVLELDNKALLYAFSKCQNLAINCFVVTPGFGSILLGPFLKVIKNFDYEIVDYSVHKKSIKGFQLYDYPKIITAINNKQTILLLDDNVVTGRTLSDLKIIFNTAGTSVLCGAVQFDWQNYFEQSKHKLFLYRFKLDLINIVTLISFFGEDFLENAKACIIKKPSIYLELLNAYGMNKSENDILTMFKLGEKFALKSKIKLDVPVKGGEEGLNDYSIKLNADLKEMFS